VADRNRLVHRRQSGRVWRQLQVKHGSPTVPMPGDSGRVSTRRPGRWPAGNRGAIVIQNADADGMLPTLGSRTSACREAYFNEFHGYKDSDAATRTRTALS